MAAGSAPCIVLNDGRWPWLVVNKHVTLDPIDYVPENLTAPDRRVTTSSVLRAEVTDAVNRLIADAATEGVGDIAVTSGYRSYGLQENLFNGYVNSSGLEAAEATSAHAGHSEHRDGVRRRRGAVQPRVRHDGPVRRVGAGAVDRRERVEVRLHRALRRGVHRHHRLLAGAVAPAPRNSARSSRPRTTKASSTRSRTSSASRRRRTTSRPCSVG